MPRPKIAKLPKPPKHSEPHTVEFSTLEAWSDVTSQPPYTYIRGRCLPQYCLSLLLHTLYHQNKRYIRIYVPTEVIPPAYLYNPAAFAQVLRRQSNCPFQFVTVRLEREAGRFRVTASETLPQKASNYLGTATAVMLGEWEKHRATGAGFAVIFPFTDMPRSYQNDHRVFKFRLRQNLRVQTQDHTIDLALQVLQDGYRVSKIPAGQ